MKSLFIYVLAAAGYVAYIQTQTAGAGNDDSNQNDILPVQIIREGFILNGLALMIFTENKKTITGAGRAGKYQKGKMQIDAHTATKARIRYLKSMTAKRSGLPGYISQPEQDRNFLPATDNIGISGRIYDVDARRRRLYINEKTADLN